MEALDKCWNFTKEFWPFSNFLPPLYLLRTPSWYLCTNKAVKGKSNKDKINRQIHGWDMRTSHLITCSIICAISLPISLSHDRDNDNNHERMMSMMSLILMTLNLLLRRNVAEIGTMMTIKRRTQMKPDKPRRITWCHPVFLLNSISLMSLLIVYNWFPVFCVISSVSSHESFMSIIGFRPCLLLGRLNVAVLVISWTPIWMDRIVINTINTTLILLILLILLI